MMTVPPNWSLPDAIRSRISPTTYGRQRAIIEDGQLVLVLHRPPKHDDQSREGVLFWRNLKGEWQHTKAGAGGVRKLVQDYAAIETKLTDEVEAAGDTLSLFRLQETLTPLARAARNLHTALQAARDGMPDDPFLIEVRDAAGDMDRNFELLLEDVRQDIQYRTVRETEEQGRLAAEAVRASHRLNILAALFLPLTAITSVFGMDLSGGFSRTSPALFWVALGMGLGLGGVMVVWVLGRAKGPR